MVESSQTRPVIRPSAIAGSWYPGSERDLRQMLDGFSARVPTEAVEGRLVGLIAPHAGYVYSGQTAAYAYKLVEGAAYDTVAIMSPNHRAYWRADFVVSSATHYETPLGVVPLDRRLIDELASQVDVQEVNSDSEHSLEIQLPFLQHALAEFTLLPVMVNTGHVSAARRLGEALANVVSHAGRKVLLVASTDLHHIPDYEEVVRRDKEVVDALESYDMMRIEAVLTRPDCSVCGRMPVIALLTAARILGADEVQILHHTNSGDVTGVRTPGQYTVGYLSAAVIARRG